MAHPKDKQTRERIVSRGAGQLTDAELLSLLVEDAPAAGSSLDLAEKVLIEAAAINPEARLAVLATAELGKLRQVASMGIKRAATLAAALELGRRAAVQQASLQDSVTGDADVAAMFRPQLASLPHEEFWALCLSSSNRVIDKIRISQGGVSATVVDHKLIIKRALERLASAIIVVHNHPSGVARPSEEDLQLTEKLRQGATLFDIALTDHIIITSENHFSFRRAGLL